MANKNKALGTSWETEVVNYLRQSGIPANRTGSATAEQGDIHAGDWIIEAKHEKVIDLPGYLKQLQAAVDRRPGGLGYMSAVFVKNRRHSTGDGYAVMSVNNYRALMVFVMAMEAMMQDITANVLAGSRD
jgi:hypothetical protein